MKSDAITNPAARAPTSTIGFLMKAGGTLIGAAFGAVLGGSIASGLAVSASVAMGIGLVSGALVGFAIGWLAFKVVHWICSDIVRDTVVAELNKRMPPPAANAV